MNKTDSAKHMTAPTIFPVNGRYLFPTNSQLNVITNVNTPAMKKPTRARLVKNSSTVGDQMLARAMIDISTNENINIGRLP